MDRPHIERREIRRTSLLAAAISLIGAGSTSACEPMRPSRVADPSLVASTRAIGCLDLSLVAERSAELPPSSLLVDLAVANRCPEPSRFDLQALRMWSEHKNGDRFWMTLYDPRGEIHAVHVEGMAGGVEQVRVDDAGPTGSIRRVCFDASDVSSHASTAVAPICRSFDREEPPSPSSDETGPEREPQPTEEPEP